MPLFDWESVSRDDPDYKMCTNVTSAAGFVVGAAVGAPLRRAEAIVATGAAGAILGFAFGYLACPYLVPAVKRKLETGSFMSDADVRFAAEAMSQYASVTQASDAVRLVSFVKSAHFPSKASLVCPNPSLIARQLLEKT